MRVGASRWAAEPAPAIAAVPAAGAPAQRLAVVTQAGAPGETCVLLVDARHPAADPLLRRCTYGIVWTASARPRADGGALALAVQPLAGWRELWVFRRAPGGWTATVVPPASEVADAGYVEFAGWVPASGELLAAREVHDAQHAGRARRSFELLDPDTLATRHRADDPCALGAFCRWQDAAWKRTTVSLR